jgi:hypothetical protein
MMTRPPIRSCTRNLNEVWAENLGRKDDHRSARSKPDSADVRMVRTNITREIKRMFIRRCGGLTFVLAAAVFVAGTLAANAAEPWLGTWKIAEAKVAPWAGKSRARSEVDKKELIGKTVTFRPREIAGPPILACKGTNYKLSDFSADMLFQGAFGEMHQKDERLDPAKIAGSLGFQGESWQVLETGCDSGIDWHFVDAATLTIGLNDYVYVLKKQ